MFEYLARDRRRLRRGTRAFAREVTIGEACVFVDHGFQWDGSNNVWLTRARAYFVMKAGPSFDLRPRSLWNRLMGVAGRSATIDPYFDEFFAVRTSSPKTMGALTTRARTLLAATFDDARLVSDGRMVTLWSTRAEFGREADGDTAAELVSEIVTFQTPALESFRRVPGAVYCGASGPWNARRPPRTELVAPVPVQIAPAELNGRPVTSVSAPCGRIVDPFAISLSGGDSLLSTFRVPVPRGVIRAARDWAPRSCRNGQRVVSAYPSRPPRAAHLGRDLVSSFAAARAAAVPLTRAERSSIGRLQPRSLRNSTQAPDSQPAIR